MEKKCNFCGNINFSQKKVQYIYKKDDKFLAVNNVPCEECEYCGEQYFQSKDLKKIEKDFIAIYKSGKKVKAEVTLPIEDFIEMS